MKKVFYCLAILALIGGLFFFKAPQTVTAASEGTWVVPSGADYTIVDIETAALTAPSWLQRFSGGIQIDLPTKICYPFRQGNYYWIPEIRHLTDNLWVKVETTKEYLFGEESGLYTCATPAFGGTFALFAYYHGPVAQSPAVDDGEKIFTVGSWSMTVGTPREQDFSNIYAYDVNWSGYSSATILAWGIEMCWESEADCKSYPDGYIDISKASHYPYPQNYDAPIMTDTSMSFAGSGGACRMAPFVELLDKSGNVLARIYYETSYANYCVS